MAEFFSIEKRVSKDIDIRIILAHLEVLLKLFGEEAFRPISGLSRPKILMEWFAFKGFGFSFVEW